MMVSYGLGSPFPEDAKLCAALNSFWPAVAPDSSRTYGFRPPKVGAARRLLFTSLPLTDKELGYHDGHPRVQGKEVKASRGWDGDSGPYLESAEGIDYVYASNPLRADQTLAALRNEPHFAGLDCVATNEFIARIYALSWTREKCDEWCRLKFGVVFNHRQSGWWLVTYETVPCWESWVSAVHPKAVADMAGDGCIFVFALVADGEEYTSPPLRLRYQVRQRFEIQLCNLAFFRPSVKGAKEPAVYLRKNGEAFEKL
jgi:hypothetical protein